MSLEDLTTKLEQPTERFEVTVKIAHLAAVLHENGVDHVEAYLSLLYSEIGTWKGRAQVAEQERDTLRRWSAWWKRAAKLHFEQHHEAMRLKNHNRANYLRANEMYADAAKRAARLLERNTELTATNERLRVALQRALDHLYNCGWIVAQEQSVESIQEAAEMADGIWHQGRVALAALSPATQETQTNE